MTRKEEIKQASNELFDDVIFYSETYKIGFKAGAMWADNHPKSPWISVEDDLPCNNPNNIHFGFTNNVLVIDDNKNTGIAFMKKYKNNEWIWDSTDNSVFLPLITHWMLIPELPKEIGD